MFDLATFATFSVYNSLNNGYFTLENLEIVLPKILFSKIQNLKPCCISIYNNIFKQEDIDYNSIVRHNHVKCVEFILNLGDSNDELFEAAIYAKNYACIKLLLDRQLRFPEWSIIYAAASGDYEFIQFALHNSCPMHPDACIEAATYGQFTCLKLCHQKGCELTWQIIDTACQYNDTEILKYCFDNGLNSDPIDASVAAQYGSLDCLKYIHENGMPWDKRTTELAAAYGNLDCLKYAHENGCDWDEQSMIWADLNHHVDCLEYIMYHGCPKPTSRQI